jgi:hypothetical protein
VDQEFDGLTTDPGRPRHCLAGYLPPLSPRLRGDRSPLWAIEGGARTPPASIPNSAAGASRKEHGPGPIAALGDRGGCANSGRIHSYQRRRCVSKKGRAHPDRRFGRSRGVRELQRQVKRMNRAGSSREDDPRLIAKKNGPTKWWTRLCLLSGEASASSLPSWPEPS